MLVLDVLWYPDVALLAVELVAATAGICRGATDCQSHLDSATMLVLDVLWYSEVAPKTLAPQIAMHSAHLTTYKTLREFIVQYLKSKNLWKRGAGTAFGTQSAPPAAPYSGPAPMEIGAVEADNKSKPKGDKGGKGDRKGKLGKGSKGASSKGDGKGKRTSTSSSTNVNAVEGTVPDNGELASTIAALQQQLAALRLTGASSVSASSTSSANAEVAEAVCSTMRGDGGQKYILVDSGATTSCASSNHFPNAALDASKRKQLCAINGTPIQQQGELAAHTTLSATTADGVDVKIPARFRLDSTNITEPVMAFCRILDDADCDMHFYRSSSGRPAHIQTPDDHTIVPPRFGSRFYMPFEDRTSGAAPPAFVAAQRHEDDVSAAPAEESAPEDGSVDIDVDLDGQPESPQPRHLPAPAAPTDDERALHNLTHADFAPWCRHCITGKAAESGHNRQVKNADAEVPVLQFDYQFFSREGQLVEEESRAATVLTATDTSSGWPLMLFVPEKGPNSYVIKAIVSWIQRLGYAKVTFQHDQESSLRSLAEQVQRELGHAHVHIQ
ncbi:unnamed protein product, partial [Symbiodinium sp. CCMP2456]